MMPRTIRNRVCLALFGLRRPRTASELLTQLNSESPGPVVSLASLSAILCRMSKPCQKLSVEHPPTLERVSDCGPRGGYGYKLSRAATAQVRFEIWRKKSPAELDKRKRTLVPALKHV